VIQQAYYTSYAVPWFRAGDTLLFWQQKYLSNSMLSCISATVVW